jgi:hypothetical protein
MILHPVADQLIALGITAGLVLIAIIVGVCLIKAAQRLTSPRRHCPQSRETANI